MSYRSPNSSLSGQYEKTINGSHPCEWSYTLYKRFSPDMKCQSLMTLSENKLCINDDGINSFQVTSFSQKSHIFNL